MDIADNLLERAHQLRRDRRRLTAALVLTFLTAMTHWIGSLTFNMKLIELTSFPASYPESTYHFVLSSFAGLLITTGVIWWMSSRRFSGPVMMVSAAAVGAMPLLLALCESPSALYLIAIAEVPVRAALLTGIARQVVASRSSRPWYILIAVYFGAGAIGWLLADLVGYAGITPDKGSDYLVVVALLVATTVAAVFLLDSDDHPRPGRLSFRDVVRWTPTAFVALLFQAPFSYDIVDNTIRSLGPELTVPLYFTFSVLGCITLLLLGKYLSSRWILFLSWCGMLFVTIVLLAVPLWTSTALIWITTSLYLTVVTVAAAAILVRIFQTPPTHLAYGAVPTVVLLTFFSGHITTWMLWALPNVHGGEGLLDLPSRLHLLPWLEADLNLGLCFVAAATVVAMAGYRLWRTPDLGDHEKERDRLVSSFD